MMFMIKRVILSFLCIFLLVISSLLFMNIFINRYKLPGMFTGNGNNTSFFSADIFGKNVLGEKNVGSILNTRIIDAGSKLLYPPQVITTGYDQWIILIRKNSIAVYSKLNDKIYKKTITDGNIISCCASPLNDKNQYFFLLLVSKKRDRYADDLAIIKILNKDKVITLKNIYRKSLETLNPWKIQTCDIDGDGKHEISICTYKATPFNPVMAKRPFLYQWTGSEIAPKWLGSRLSSPFKDLIFADINHDGRDELISIEVLENANEIVNSYAWKGFGFEAIGKSGQYKSILMIEKVKDPASSKENVIINAEEKDKSSFFTLEYRNGRLISKGTSKQN